MKNERLVYTPEAAAKAAAEHPTYMVRRKRISTFEPGKVEWESCGDPRNGRVEWHYQDQAEDALAVISKQQPGEYRVELS